MTSWEVTTQGKWDPDHTPLQWFLFWKFFVVLAVHGGLARTRKDRATFVVTVIHSLWLGPGFAFPRAPRRPCLAMLFSRLGYERTTCSKQPPQVGEICAPRPCLQHQVHH